MTSGSLPAQIHVEVVLAMPERQEIVPLELESGSTVADAIEQSAIVEKFPGVELDPGKVGIFGGKVAMDHVLREGDRVEIYRPLIADPKEVRRQRALKQSKS